VNYLTRVSGIHELSLPLDAEDLNSVTHLTSLTALDISSCNTIKPKKLASISTFPNLATLKLPAFTTDATIQHVNKCTSLVNLDLSLCEHISEAGVKQLTRDMSSLKSIKLTGNYLNKEVVLTDYIKLITTSLANSRRALVGQFLLQGQFPQRVQAPFAPVQQIDQSAASLHHRQLLRQQRLEIARATLAEHQRA
jgi:hypothetical protein